MNDVKRRAERRWSAEFATCVAAAADDDAAADDGADDADDADAVDIVACAEVLVRLCRAASPVPAPAAAVANNDERKQKNNNKRKKKGAVEAAAAAAAAAEEEKDTVAEEDDDDDDDDDDTNGDGGDEAAGRALECFLAVLSSSDVRRLLTCLARHHPRTTLAPLMLRSLSPVAAELLTTQFEAADAADDNTAEQSKAFYVEFYGAFQDGENDAFLSALLDRKVGVVQVVFVSLDQSRSFVFSPDQSRSFVFFSRPITFVRLQVVNSVDPWL